MNEKLKYALEYSKLGWHVIPLNKRSGANGSREWQGIKLKSDIEPL